MYKHAESLSDRLLVLLYCKSNNPQTKIGFSVGKKYGKAVTRNKIRRRLKAAASTLMPRVVGGYNLIVVPRMQDRYDYWELLESMQKLLGKAGLVQ